MRTNHAINTVSRAMIGLGASLVLAGCSGSGASSEPDSSEPDSSGLDSIEVAPGWERLIEGSWTLPPGTEGYQCVRKTLKEDMYISSFKSVGPLGTHHTVLSVGEPSGPDGISECGGFDNHSVMMFGSGVGDVEFHFPEGVGVKVSAGQQLFLSLHLLNAGDKELVGASGTVVELVTADQIQHEAEVILAGPISIALPPGEVTDIQGDCTIERDITVLAVAPHMHELGAHMKMEAIREEGDLVIHDGPYDFQDQQLYPIEPLPMKAGDKMRVTCTYDNNTNELVGFGESSTAEMCFGSFYRYPRREAGATGFACIL